jgi:hypothetical protein
MGFSGFVFLFSRYKLNKRERVLRGPTSSFSAVKDRGEERVLL